MPFWLVICVSVHLKTFPYIIYHLLIFFNKMGKFTTVDNFLEKNSDISNVENIINSKNVENRESFSNYVNILSNLTKYSPE